MYEFSTNNIKLQRAIAFCSGNPDTGCVLAVYKKLGGAVKPGYIEPIVIAVAEEVHFAPLSMTATFTPVEDMPVVETEEPVVIEPAVIKTAVRKTAAKKAK